MRRAVLFISNFLADTVLSRSYMEDLADQLESRDWRVIRTSARPHKLARIADMVATTWRERDAYDVAHVAVFSGTAFVWAEAVAFELRRLRKPFVITLHGGSLPEFAARWPRRVTRLLRSAALVTAPSGFLRERMAPYRADIEVIPNAIDVQRFTFRPRTHPRPRLVWLRAFHAIYNPVLAIDVLARLAADYPDAHLRMVGPTREDSARAAVEQRIRELDLVDRVEIVGRIASRDVPAAFENGDVFINTTNVDNAPLSLLEAMASGIPVVSTNVGGLPYMLTHGDNALLVPPRNADAMASAVATLVEQPAFAERIVAGGRKLAERFGWPAILDRWEHTFAALRSAS